MENPFVPHFLHDAAIPITLTLVVFLGLIFLRGFQEAIGLAVVLVLVLMTSAAFAVMLATMRRRFTRSSLIFLLEVLRRAERNPKNRPAIYVGG